MNNNGFDFSDIAPYDDALFPQKIQALVKEPGFLHAIGYTMPEDAVPVLLDELLKITNTHDFQRVIMIPFLDLIAKTTTDGISLGGIKYVNPNLSYTFISNHRDIVLDASFLNLALIKKGIPTTEVAIGNNLLIYDWIEDVVRLNKSFIVKRNTGVREALSAAKQLSAYIHHTILDKRESVWIAQREGRAKDSSDHTQESLIKMLALEGEGSFIEKIKELNIIPVSISYEYDPNDYLKAKEFLLKHRDPAYKKSQRDDLFSMETGLLQHKGKVHFQLTPRINARLDQIGESKDKNTSAKWVGRIIDQAIHRSYEIFDINYVAYDLLHEGKRFASKYDQSVKDKVLEYFNRQLDKVGLSDVTLDERDFMMNKMYVMYANPLINKLRTIIGIEN